MHYAHCYAEVWEPLVRARVGYVDRVNWKGYIFCFLTLLAYEDVMSWLGSIVVAIGCCGGLAIVRLMGALGASGRFEFVVCSCPVFVLTR